MKWTLATVNFILLAMLCSLFFRGEGGKRGSFDGVAVLFLCVGFEHDPPMAIWRKELDRAEEDFGCKIKIWNCGWDDKTILDNFSQAITYRPDVICLPGYENESMYKPLMEEALRNGIRVSVYHTPLPELQRLHRAEGVGFTGHDEYANGRKLAVRAVQKFALDESSDVLVFGNSRPNADLRLRSEGIAAALKERGIRYKLIDMRDYWYGDPSSSMDQALSDYLASHPKPTCILHDAGGIEFLTRAFSGLGIAPGEIPVGAFDCTPGGLSALKQNYVQLINGRDGTSMMYFAVLQGCMSAKYGTSGMDIIAPSVFYDSTNIGELEKLIEMEG